MYCAFTGHRPHRLPWGEDERDPRCAALKRRMEQEARAQAADGVEVFLCGMARGCDLYFAETVLELRRSQPRLQLWAVLPCRTQADRWPESERRRYEELCARCDRVVLVQEIYTPDCMRRRNLWLAEHADRMITVFDGGPGGTAWTVAAARRQGVEIVPIWL